MVNQIVLCFCILQYWPEYIIILLLSLHVFILFPHVNVHFMKSGNLDLLFFILSPVPNQEPGFQGTFNKLLLNILFTRASQVTLLIKNLSANAEEVRDMGSIPGAGRSPGGGHGNPLHYSCLENPMDGRTWWATVHKVVQSWTWLKGLSMHVGILFTKNTPEKSRT